MTDDPNPELTDQVEALLLRVLVDAGNDVDKALMTMGGENRTLRELFEAMRDALDHKSS